MNAAAPAIRLKGHALETIANRGGLVASCSCGEVLSPAGTGQTGRLVALNIFTGDQARNRIRSAHEAHKATIKGIA